MAGEEIELLQPIIVQIFLCSSASMLEYDLPLLPYFTFEGGGT